MSKCAGIWIETKNAMLITVEKDKPASVKTIESTIETRERIQGESKKFGRFGNQYLTFEKKRRNKREEQTTLFIKTIIQELDTFDKFVIFGPSKMKHKFEKEIFLIPNLVSKLEGIYNADRLTKNQKVAWVNDYFKTIA
ncbi:MAG TPA: hypothetical protein ENK75_00960 [Saprospiraceae bacterium]|nr:hypothetical protein [Saprospiraceae bacterium]